MATKLQSTQISSAVKASVLCAAVASAMLTGGCTVQHKTATDSYAITEKIASLRVEDYGGAIDVVGGTADEIKVTENFEYSDDKPHTEHSVKGSELLLKNAGCGSGAKKCGVQYKVQVPAATALALELGGGAITVRGMSGATYAKSEGGSVEVSNSTAKSVTAIVDGGDATASFSAVPDKVDVQSGGGDASVTLPPGTYAVDATTDGGGRQVSVKNDPTSPHKIKAHTDGGRVSVLSAG
ncbi:hypothetical protein [Krasilnikovia sp. MM14-A1259]|uniref:hypothetical protein n=1 Tax=Krasilnikovia sp. MM14-A1259 TaxID=3373539 RepID=UPI003806B69F